MNVLLSLQAEKQLRKLQKFDQLAIGEKIRKLGQPFTFGEEKLSGFSDAYRVRVGTYRIVYRKIKGDIVIIRIQHRRDVYRMLKEILT